MVWIAKINKNIRATTYKTVQVAPMLATYFGFSKSLLGLLLFNKNTYLCEYSYVIFVNVKLVFIVYHFGRSLYILL